MIFGEYRGLKKCPYSGMFDVCHTMAIVENGTTILLSIEDLAVHRSKLLIPTLDLSLPLIPFGMFLISLRRLTTQSGERGRHTNSNPPFSRPRKNLGPFWGAQNHSVGEPGTLGLVVLRPCSTRTLGPVGQSPNVRRPATKRQQPSVTASPASCTMSGLGLLRIPEAEAIWRVAKNWGPRFRSPYNQDRMLGFN